MLSLRSRSILDTEITGIDQRTPLCIGSAKEVDRFNDALSLKPPPVKLPKVAEAPKEAPTADAAAGGVAAAGFEWGGTY